MMSYKRAGKSNNGEQLVKCPICKKRYLKHAINQHLSQAAGKEAQYHMAHLLYREIEKLEAWGQNKEQALTDVQSYNTIMKACPHWKYLMDNPKAIPDFRPVHKK